MGPRRKYFRLPSNPELRGPLWGLGPPVLREAVSEAFGVAPPALERPSRRESLVLARRALALLLRESGLTEQRIAKELGLRHHSTVSLALRAGGKGEWFETRLADARSRAGKAP